MSAALPARIVPDRTLLLFSTAFCRRSQHACLLGGGCRRLWCDEHGSQGWGREDRGEPRAGGAPPDAGSGGAAARAPLAHRRASPRGCLGTPPAPLGQRVPGGTVSRPSRQLLTQRTRRVLRRLHRGAARWLRRGRSALRAPDRPAPLDCAAASFLKPVRNRRRTFHTVSYCHGFILI